jgi:hypothetical protein
MKCVIGSSGALNAGAGVSDPGRHGMHLGHSIHKAIVIHPESRAGARSMAGRARTPNLSSARLYAWVDGVLAFVAPKSPDLAPSLSACARKLG